MIKFVPYRSLINLSLALILISCNAPAKNKAEEEAPAVVQTPVTVTSVSTAPLTEYIELNATSTFLQKSFVKANANGYLLFSHVTPGQHVSSGQILFAIKTKEAQSIGNAVNILDSTFKFSGTISIKAGETGFITQLNHQAGDYVQDGEQLAIISDLNSFVFLLDLPYELRPYVMNKKNVELILPDGEKLIGFISAAMPTVDATAQTQSIVIKVNASHTIPENLIAKVKIIKSLKNNTISLPKAAVLSDETQSNFWIMKMIDSTTAVKVPVTKGMETGGQIEITSPVIEPSARILVSGNYGLGDTAKVKITIQEKQ